MFVVTWGNPVGLIIFLAGLGVALVLYAIAIRIVASVVTRLMGRR